MDNKLQDLIDLLEVKLVVDLEDIENDPSGIFNTFILTSEVEEGLTSILRAIDNLKGCGAFIKGNYGSGKSHFLSFLYMLLQGRSHSIIEPYSRLKGVDLNLIKISLVRYPSSIGLERIVMDAFNYKEEVSDRLAVFERIISKPTVIFIDELSEFLRSKPSPPQFYEDIRFLQFLGEYSSKNRLWVIASLQEWIEETGHISSSIFTRIKDRYPLKINLSSSHIEDIIDQRLIKKKPGAQEIIRAVFEELKGFYPNLNLPFEGFRKTYPLHPFTTRFLIGLTRVFSQHRGVIQFVQSEVKKRLQDPADSLITAEAIFDHFEDRIREIPDYTALARIAYDYYKTNIDKIFANKLQREIASSAVKIMILSEISPLEKRKSASDIAEMLLKKISLMSESINYDYIKNGVLEPLVAHQMYIQKEGDRYFIDVAVEEGLKIRGRIKSLRERFNDKGYLLKEICRLSSMPYLPLAEINEGKRYRFRWQNSLRECMIVIQSHALSRDDLDRLLEGIYKRVDGYLIILSPFLDRAFDWDSDSPKLFADFNEQQGAPTVYLKAIVFWHPRKISGEELLFIEEFVAKQMLLRDFPSLRDELRKEEPLFRETLTKIFFEGHISDGLNTPRDIKNLGLIPLERLLSHLYESSLSEIHPEHHRVMPRLEFYSSQQVNVAFTYFIKQGRITLEEAEQKGIVQFIKGMLEPLGIIAKKGNSYVLSLRADNELVSSVLNLIRLEQNAYNIRQNLRKGRWGLSNDQTDLLLSALILSGYVIPYNRLEPVELREIVQLSSGEITSLKEGKAIDPALISAIALGGFIWGEVEGAPTPATLRVMWKEAVNLLRGRRKVLEELQTLINKYKDYSLFKLLRLDMPIINRLSLFLGSLSLNVSAQEGIERFLRYLNENQDMELQIAYIESIYTFLLEEFQFLNKCYLYLSHPAFKVEEHTRDIREQALHCLKGLIEALGSYKSGASEIKQQITVLKGQWDSFFDKYTTAYRDAHDRYYDAPIFRARHILETSQEARALRKIAHLVASVNFQGEWWDIKKAIDELPALCKADLNQELFSNPLCRCGFQSGQRPPEVEIDISELCDRGIRNFLDTIQLPENREKIESSLSGLTLSGKRSISESMLSLLQIKSKSANIPLLLSLLQEEVLQEIENALKGRWQIRTLPIDSLLRSIKGRRFRHSELRSLLLKWIGNDEDSIIHVKAEDTSGTDLLSEGLSRYGSEGKRVSLELLNCGANLSLDEAPISLLDSIRLNGFSIKELINILHAEGQSYMRKRLRGEIAARLWSNSNEVCHDLLPVIEDEPLSCLVRAISLIKSNHKFDRGIDIFQHTLAPLTVILERLLYENAGESLFDREVIEMPYRWLQTHMAQLQASQDSLEGTGLSQIRKGLSGVVVIFDGLRYDLWLILREVMLKEGWKINEEVFIIDKPATTNNFRTVMGITEDTGEIEGRSYVLLKAVERDMGKRNLKRFLKQEQDIKFLHFNFIDTKTHSSLLDLYPLYSIIKSEFSTGIKPLLQEIGTFYLISDHGFSDTKGLKERYKHGGGSIWERILPFVQVKM